MGYTRYLLGKKYPKYINVPTIDNFTEFEKGAIILLNQDYHDGFVYRQFVAFVKLTKIVHSEYYDIIFVRPTRYGESKSIRMIVSESMARRQLLTCKQGWYVSIIGFGKYNRKVKEDGNNNYDEKLVLNYFVCALQGWYVPNLVDIKRNKLKLETDLQIESKKSDLDFIEEIRGLTDDK